MKKMNFYFNPSRCCGLFFAMAFMLFSSVMSFAQITAVTSVATQPANCNGTSGTITGVVTVVASGVNTSVTVTAGAVSSGSILIPAGTTTANYSLTLPAGCPGAGVSHTPSATLISSVTGSVINTVAAPARTLTIPADVTPPVGPATANFSSPSLCSFSPTFAGAGTQTVTTNFGVTHTENDCIAACNVITSVAGVPGVVVPGPGGTATFNMTTTNSAGLTTTTVVTITFTNHAPVAATCPTPQAFTTASCASPTMVVNFTEPTFTDADIACDVLVIDRFGQAPGSTFTVGTHTIRYVATDNAGATATCNVTVTVAAPAPPALVGGSITVTSPVQLTGCNTTGTLTYTLNPPTGGCGLLVLENLTGLPTGSIVAPGTYNISATWRDAAGQVSAPATASITILPSTTCSGVVIQNVTKVDADCNTNNGSININSLGSTNNGSICYFLRVEKESTTNNLALGAIAVTPGNTSITGLPPGNYTITGQIYNCVSGLIIDVRVNTITIGVKPDVTAPVLAGCTPPTAVTEGACNAAVAIAFTAPTATDDCGVPTVVQTGGPANGSLQNAGTYTIQYTATNAAGLTSTCSFDVVVLPNNDVTPPVIANCTAPAAVTEGNCGTPAAIAFTAPTATDNCGAATVVQTGGPANGSLQNAGVYTIQYTATNAAGLTSTCSFDVVVNKYVDNVNPLLASCPAVVNVTEGACATPVAITYADATFTDNCAVTSIDRVGPVSGSMLTRGTYIITQIGRDAAGNASAPCTRTIVVAPNDDVTAPVLAGCPANQNYVVACGARQLVTYATPTATDNCSAAGQIAITQTGPVSGSVLDAGVYPVIFTAVDAAGNSVTCSFTITITNPAPTDLACIGGSATAPGANITLAANCATQIRPNHVLISCIGNEADYDVVVTTLGGGVIAGGIVGIGQVGKVLKVQVTYRPTGVTCWGYVKIEDKTAPAIICPRDVTLTCANADNANNLAIVGELSGPLSTVAALNQASAVDATATTFGLTKGVNTNDGRVLECSKWTQYWSDVVTGSVCAGRTIVRTWWAKDEWGNQSATCTQIITIQAPATPVLGNLLVNTSCTIVTPAVLQAILNNEEAAALGFKVTGFTTTCGFELVPNGVMQLRGICDGDFTIMRMYKLVNTCTGTFTEFTQTIKVTNTVPPTVTAKYDNYTREKDGTYCWMMNGTMRMESDNWKTIISNVTTTFNGTTTDVFPLASSTMCNAANIRVQLAGIDNGCAAGTITYTTTDSRIQISASGLITNKNGQPFMKNLNGTDPTFTVIATNACGVSVRHTFRVILFDNMTPNTVCKVFTTATLDENGFVRVPVSAFENGSSDNCGIERQMVRRMTKSNDDACGVQGQTAETACWNDYVDFTCADVGDKDADGGQLIVVLRSVDFQGNVSDCMVRIEIIDKTGPTCTNQPQIDRLCTAADLSSYKTLFVTPAAFDNCGIKSTTFADNKELTISCGKGDVTRTWTFTDCANKTTTCTQKIVVTPVYGFTVPKLADENKSCALGTNDITAIMEADRRTIVSSATLNTFAGGKTCSAPVVETEYWKYSSTQYCQIYRIRYTIIDHCAPYFGYTIATPGTCNVMLDAQGRRLGTPNAACTSVESIVGATVAGVQQHIVVYERYIYVNDVEAPTNTTVLAGDNKCTTWNGTAQVDNTGCTFRSRKVLTGADNCGTNGTAASDPGTLRFMWRAVVKNVTGMVPGTQLGAANGATAAAMNTEIVDLTNLAFGTYTICFRIIDLCGNMSQEFCYDIEGADCKAPEVLVHNKIVALGGIAGNASTGMAILKYVDIRNRITDNCDGDLTNDNKIVLEKVIGAAGNVPPASATQEVMYTCADLSNGTTPSTYASQKTLEVRVWAKDKTGNWNYAVSTITLQDNDGICATGTVAVFGSARTENNAIVNNVTVSTSVNGAASASTSVANGTFNIVMAPAANVQVRAAKNNNDDAASGVTTFDIAKMSQHVLDIEKFATPYQMIAADVDKSGEVDATDMLHARRFILKITPSLPGGNFRFVDKAYTFRNAANPFGEDFPEVVNIASLTANTAANFVAVKLGDVNGSYNALAPRSTRTLTFLANDMTLVAGNEYTVNIASDKMDAAAFQGTFSFNGATVKSVKAGSLNNMTDGNFGIFANAVTTSWNGKSQDASEVLAITFVANKSGKLSEMLTVNSALTQAIANDVAGNEMNVNLKFNTGKVAGGEFALYQNQPNPVANETTIGFNLPKDGQARLTITAVDGKVAKVINGDFKAGFNTITVNKSDLNANGVFYYRLETADHSASKKMVIIE